jgi:hypothetical protein
MLSTLSNDWTAQLPSVKVFDRYLSARHLLQLLCTLRSGFNQSFQISSSLHILRAILAFYWQFRLNDVIEHVGCCLFIAASYRIRQMR